MYSAFYLCVERLDHVEELGRTSSLCRDLEQTISANEIKGFGEVDECKVQWDVLLSALPSKLLK